MDKRKIILLLLLLCGAVAPIDYPPESPKGVNGISK
jgi:hypothetical protein